MSYVNAAGQTVDVGCRVAYAGYRRSLTIGTVASFTELGNPRISVEGKTVDWVRNRYRHSQEYVKHSGANIWARRPGSFLVHKETGQFVPYRTWCGLPQNERWDYEHDSGLLDSQWIEFTKPYIRTIVKRDTVMVIGDIS